MGTELEPKKSDSKKNVEKVRNLKKEAYLKNKAERAQTVEIEVEGFVCVLKRPDRGVYNRAIGLITPMAGREIDILKAGSIILNSCWVSGDEEIKTDDELNIGACIKAIELLEIKEATIKKN